MTNLTQEQLAALIANVVGQVLAGQAASPKGVAASAKPGKSLEARDRSIVAGFKRRGIQDVVLMDRSDKSKPYNVRPYRDWLAAGRQVRKNERSVRGLFHQSQTDAIAPTKANAVPKGKIMPIKAQPTLV
jgi:hypothetical protein